MRKVDDGKKKKKEKKRMAFLVSTTSLPAVYRPNGYTRTTTAGTPHARANICRQPIEQLEFPTNETLVRLGDFSGVNIEKVDGLCLLCQSYLDNKMGHPNTTFTASKNLKMKVQMTLENDFVVSICLDIPSVLV